MPTYEYEFLDNGEHVELVLSVAEMEHRQLPDGTMTIDGRKARRVYGFETQATSAGWPIYSQSIACHPRQVKQFSETLQQAGVPTFVRSDGCPELRDRAHRKKVFHALKVIDLDGGCGDAT